MTVFGFHASHEQVHPSALLDAVIHAESAGFQAAMCSDHFAPWSERQGHSAFAWAWLGAALQATNLRLGVVNAPGQRYHPAIIAQAAATLAAMYPDRFWAALGSGEAANEHITGDAWPRKDVRNARLAESVDVMRRLFAGEEVSTDGLVTVDRAKLWTRPDTPPPLLAAAVSPATAAWAAGWADGLATVAQAPDDLKRMVDAYRGAGGDGPLVLQVHLSYAKTDAEALAIAHDQWRTNVFSPPVCWDLDTPEAFDEAAKHVHQDDMHSTVLVSSDPGWHAGKLAEFADLGFDEIYLHHVGVEQTEFLDVFGDRVLPHLIARKEASA
ncbi:TIGR03557 family F420-dependent LLM class oxidoreductase [Mycetocola manganoxydans]|uniref:TIGR03557 family F420-dependent LLM class oxidoreductase n=1 Tax=Mycetocola manganoxydans TaxID=699879 RepID=A0A3L7A077_9MICO|nr:TIGR03885 family FMN-dependent LLM class oxidoreductase [Mycetocola manganoxydans]RLP73051.1 TIGR03557 family F420-dependent LLM class oxidoreductase [Mycetocola manganoxydans]GHD44339.1 LLM class F420-dependent oxidoreductase [Mycetocola manganoxydans]